ncbi:MAG TPA: DinB family protein [Lacipirellulaceae bacterium]|nr:DinB family protein [Lacipirellulaceae bacterium]
MNAKDAIRTSLRIADFMVESYLADIGPQELLVRPAPDANHLAWQLGHLISAEFRLVEAAAPGSMRALPPGFAERHTKDTAISDNAADFLSKDEYLSLAKTVRAGTLAALETLSGADLDKPVTGRVPPFVKCAGDCFVTVGTHWVLHSGQWVVLRRKLGRQRKF